MAAALLSGCSGQPCDDLPRLQAERGAAQQAYLELAGSGTAGVERTEQADADLHALERRVRTVEQQCAGR